MKNIVVGVTGGIAAYKTADLVSRLVKLGNNVDIIMTENAKQFVSKLTFESLSTNKVVDDMFQLPETREINHISLAKKADIIVIAPASANTIAKIAHGFADDMLTTTVLATKAPILVCPAMNTNMYLNPIVQENINILIKHGIYVLAPEEGRLACGDVGVGRLASVDNILDYIEFASTKKHDLKGKKVLITTGPTEESIDGVRFITNHSSGKMGIALAKEAFYRGAEVTLVVGKLKVDVPKCIKNVISVETTQAMRDVVIKNVKDSDIIIKAAAPGDYKLKEVFSDKLKQKDLVIELTKNPDIAEEVGKIKKDKTLVIFCAEKNNLQKNALDKLKKKNADIVVANDITKEGAGFDYDTNIVTIATKNGDIKDYPIMKKYEVAKIIINEVVSLS